MNIIPEFLKLFFYFCMSISFVYYLIGDVVIRYYFRQKIILDLFRIMIIPVFIGVMIGADFLIINLLSTSVWLGSAVVILPGCMYLWMFFREGSKMRSLITSKYLSVNDGKRVLSAYYPFHIMTPLYSPNDLDTVLPKFIDETFKVLLDKHKYMVVGISLLCSLVSVHFHLNAQSPILNFPLMLILTFLGGGLLFILNYGYIALITYRFRQNNFASTAYEAKMFIQVIDSCNNDDFHNGEGKPKRVFNNVKQDSVEPLIQGTPIGGSI